MLYRRNVQLGVKQNLVALPIAVPIPFPFPLDPFCCCQNLSQQLFAGACAILLDELLIPLQILSGCSLAAEYWSLSVHHGDAFG